MSHQILAQTTASVSEFKRNPMATVAAGERFPVAKLIVLVVAVGKRERNPVFEAAAER